MIVWSGWGVLTVIFGLLGVLAGRAGLEPLLVRLSSSLPPNTGLAIGLLAAALVNGFVALRLGSAGRELIDARSGQRVVLRRPNTLFFIPMRYWSVVFVVLAIAALFAPAIDDAPNDAPNHARGQAASLSRPSAG